MDAKLKALKVVDLKHILSSSATPIPSKANKSDLIHLILATPAALQQYNKIYSDDLLTLPDDVDWNDDLTTLPAEPAPHSAPAPVASTPVSLPKPQSTPSKTTAAATSSPSKDQPASQDPELDARRRRAERFGTSLVMADKKDPPGPSKSAQTPDDPEKLKAREARFGPIKPINSSQKRSAPVDPVEEEKRRKRAERFGLS